MLNNCAGYVKKRIKNCFCLSWIAVFVLNGRLFNSGSGAKKFWACLGRQGNGVNASKDLASLSTAVIGQQASSSHE